MTAPVSRRIVFHGLGALGVAAALAGCGGSDETTGPGGTPTDDAAPPSSSGGGDNPGGQGGSGGGSEAGIAGTDEVPVGGGLILSDERIVITQPTEGDFKAFTAVCTHLGNIVTSVEDGTIHCAFHGSAFSAESGEVETGPAGAPLAEFPITVEDGRILLA